MKGTFAERAKIVRKKAANSEESAESKRQKKKAAKEQARMQQQQVGLAQGMAGYPGMMPGGKNFFL